MILLLACADEAPPLAPAAGVWVEARKVDEGAPVVLHAPADAAMPTVEGLTFTQTAVGDDGQATWAVTGEPGSYVVDVGTTRLYLDLGVDGPTGGPMDDVVLLPPPPPPVWPWVVGGGVAAAGLVAGAWFAWQRFKPVPPPPPPEPPDVVARREWRRIMAAALEPEQRALALSGVVRRYFEGVYRWPATARTTREILGALAGDLTAAEHESAGRLLRAMDLVKFAERADVAGLFVTFDQDFERILARGSRV